MVLRPRIRLGPWLLVLWVTTGGATTAAPQDSDAKRTAPARTAKRQVSTTPVYRTGPDGAVHLDRPVILGSPTASPYAVAPAPVVAPTMPLSVGPPTVTTAPQVVAPSVPSGGQAMIVHPGWQQQQAVGPRLPRWLRAFEKDYRIFQKRLRRKVMYPMIGHHTGIFGGFIHLRSRDAEVGFALPVGGGTPVGGDTAVDPGFEPGFYAGGSFALDETSSFAVTYHYLRTRTANRVSGAEIRSLVTHPASANTASDVDLARATLDVNYDILDADFRSILYGETTPEGGACAVNWVVGARFAELDEKFRSAFESPGVLVDVNTDLHFRGAGLRAGLETERHACATRFFAYGRGFTSLLFGEYDGVYRQRSNINGTEAVTSSGSGRVVPIVDFEVGVGWLGPREHLRLTFGYLVSAWLNAVSTDAYIDAVRRDRLVGLGSDVITFDGLTARADLRF